MASPTPINPREPSRTLSIATAVPREEAQYGGFRRIMQEHKFSIVNCQLLYGQANVTRCILALNPQRSPIDARKYHPQQQMFIFLIFPRRDTNGK